MIRGGAVVAGAVALALLVTWPLVRCLGSCLGPPPDTLLSTYFLAWVSRALTTAGVPLLDAPMFAPYANTLALGEYLPAYAPVAIPTIALTGNPVAAHGVVLLVLYVAAALGAYALARELLGARGPAALAGIGFAYSARMLDQSYNLQTLAIAWVPWIFLVLERLAARPSLGRAAWLLPLGAGLALSSMNIFVFTGLAAAVWLLVAAAQRRVTRRHLLLLLAVGAPVAALVWAYVTPYRRAAAEWALGRTLAEVELGATTLAHLAQPPPESLLRWIVAGEAGASDPVQGLVLGVTLTGLALLGVAAMARRGRPGRARLLPYGVVAGVALVLALGPTFRTAWGPVPLPYRVLHAAVPGFHAVRTPARFLLYVDLAVALFAAAGAARLLAGRSPRAWRAGLACLGGLLLLEAVLIPFPGAVPRLDPAALPATYRWLRDAPPGTVALGIPMGDWVNVAASALHLRRTVNGWSSFEPPRYRELVAAMQAFPDTRTLALVRSSGATVVLVDRAWLTPARVAQLGEPGSGFRPERLFPTHVVYRVLPAPLAEPGQLLAEARMARGRLCAVLRNPGPEWMPFYPARRLTLMSGGSESTAWLPLDLAPGAEHQACLDAGAADVEGVVTGGPRPLRFRIAPGQPAIPLRESPA